MANEAGPESSRRWIGRVLVVLCAASVLVLLGLPLSGLFSSRTRPVAKGARSAPASAVPVPVPSAPDQLHVVVSKNARRLVLYRGDQELRSFPIVLGPNSVGNKQREGDKRTPEGTYYVCEKNEKSKYYLFIGISYPNAEDAARGLQAGLITQPQHDAIVRAIAARKTPPWYTRLGGQIGLHGGGTAWNWTEGCVALENGDMRDLYALIRVGATVTIQP